MACQPLVHPKVFWKFVLHTHPKFSMEGKFCKAIYGGSTRSIPKALNALVRPRVFRAVYIFYQKGATGSVFFRFFLSGSRFTLYSLRLVTGGNFGKIVEHWLVYCGVAAFVFISLPRVGR